MELLDATIALAVTLAVLATTITVIMEIVVRFLGLKSGGQIKLFKEIYTRAFDKEFQHKADEFKFVTAILQNPFSKWTVGSKTSKAVSSNSSTPTELSNPSIGDLLGTRSLCVYDWVSTEHVFRRILSLEGVIDNSRDELVRSLKAFNTEYNQLCGAAKTRFKNNCHNWSVVIGLLLALLVNVNGLRIFETFVADPTLAAGMVAQMDSFVEQSEQAQKRLDAAFSDKNAEDFEKINESLQQVKTQLAGLEDSAIPIGWQYAPHCHFADWIAPLGENKSYCKSATDEIPAPSASPWTNFAALAAVMITGLLIGLGAPFWFDLAKRLAQVRSMFKGDAAAEPFDGKTPVSSAANYESETDSLINKLVDEALAAKAAATREQAG